MNTDPLKSTTFCGCDEGANHLCARHTKEREEEIRLVSDLMKNGLAALERTHDAMMDQMESEFLAERDSNKKAEPEDMGAHIARLHDEADATNEADLEECLASRSLFPDSAQGRKDHPVFTGVLMYFPDAIAAVAHVSKIGNGQHNPGQPLHWARGKSTDQTDTATRHLMDHGVGNVRDTDGSYHLAKAAWRVLAELQLTIEREREERR